MERTDGAADIHIHKHQYPLKVYLILVFGLVIVAVAFGGRGWLSGSSSSRIGLPSSTNAPFVVYVPGSPEVIVKEITAIPTMTRTPSPTPTRRPLQSPTPSLTPTQSFKSATPANGESETGT